MENLITHLKTLKGRVFLPALGNGVLIRQNQLDHYFHDGEYPCFSLFGSLYANTYIHLVAVTLLLLWRGNVRMCITYVFIAF